MTRDIFDHTIVEYIIDKNLLCQGNKPSKLPPMHALAKTLGISKGKLREELIAAQAWGIIDMRPGDGTYIQPFDFYTAIRPVVLYSIACDQQNFDRFYRLRAQLEITFWESATSTLTPDILRQLETIVIRAKHKLNHRPIEIPHQEHREFHMLIFSKLDNAFVHGLLQAYWDAYEAVELHRYFELNYYEEMWNSHHQIVQSLQAGQVQQAQKVLVNHFSILENRLHTVGG